MNCTVAPVSGCVGDQVKAAPAGGVQETVVVSTAVAETTEAAWETAMSTATSRARPGASAGTWARRSTSAVSPGDSVTTDALPNDVHPRLLATVRV